MIREQFANHSAPIPDLAYARGSGSREKGAGRGEGRCVASMHQPHLGASPLPHATKREGGWDACR